MLKHERYIRKSLGQIGAITHLPGKDLEFKQKSIIHQTRQTAAPLRVFHRGGLGREAILRVLEPMNLLSNATRRRKFGQLLDQTSAIVIREIGISDVSMRPARSIA